MAQKQRVDDQRAYLLHSYPYSETSLILDIFARDHGRVALLARGARRPRAAVRGVLLGFQPLELGWFGGNEVKTLAKAEWIGGVPLPRGRCLLLGYYLNELLIKLLPREDAHPALFDAYEEAIMALAHDVAEAPELRRFEITLLRELGYGLSLEHDADGQELQPKRQYMYLVERGPMPAHGNDGLPTLSGKTLLDMGRDDYSDPRTLAESKLLMRQLLAHHLNGHALQSRRVFMDLQDF